MTQDEIDAVFHPERPVTKKGLLIGREREVQRTLVRLGTAGGHVLISGHRGIGKTSIARVAETMLRADNPKLLFEYVSCDSSTAFSDITRRVLAHVQGEYPDSVAGSPAKAADLIAMVAGFLLIDEVDRLEVGQRILLGEFMKALSDRATVFSICVVGIARTANDIFSAHLSVHRCLNEVHVRSLSRADIAQLVDEGFRSLNQRVRGDVVIDIARLSQGFPSNAVMICRHAAESLLQMPAKELGPAEFRRGLRLLLEERGAAPMEVLERVFADDNSQVKRWLLLSAGLLEIEEFSDDQLYKATRTRVELARPLFESLCLGFCLDGAEKLFDVVRPGIMRFTDPRMPMVIFINEFLRIAERQAKY